MQQSSISLRALRSDGVISRGRSVFACDRTGFVDGSGETGLWVYETRLLSRLGWRIDDATPTLITASNVQQHVSLSYFILLPPERDAEGVEAAQQTLELRLTRSVGEGLCEDVALVNHTQKATAFVLALEIDADFSDWLAQSGGHAFEPKVTKHVNDEESQPRLFFDCRAQHTGEDQGESVTRSIHRRLVVSAPEADSEPQWSKEGARFHVKLPPHGTFRARVTYSAEIDGAPVPLVVRHAPEELDPWERRTEILCSTSARVSPPGRGHLPEVVANAFERARRDLYALDLYHLDGDARGVTLAAGVPGYLGLFGRDSLITGFQATLVDSRILVGALDALARHVGTRIDDFRDEQPDKLVHEVHTGPCSTLEITPHDRYYGGVSSSLQYPAFVASLWHWTGDEGLVRRLVPTAHRALRWVDKFGDLDGDGFIEYDRRSRQGGKNQGWKDSGDAIVYPDGAQVPDPLGTTEMQASLYTSLASFSELLADLGDADGSSRLALRARDFRERFNAAFWMEDECFYAMGMDRDKRLIRSIASNGGHVLSTGIVDGARAPTVANRLLANDMFSGWGVRTLSARHPAYDPWSYHRGSVWPAENAFFVYGMARYGLYEQMHVLARAQFEAAALFEMVRLPEVFAGHARDAEHPFPAIYPRANSPQSWSSSAVVFLLRAMLGIAPYAPLDVLLVDPHLPEWLPEITVHGIHVGTSAVTLRFERTAAGETKFSVLDGRGPLRVVRDVGVLGALSRGERARAALTALAKK